MQFVTNGVAVNKTSSANIKSSQGSMLGFYVNSTSSGTIQFYDDSGTGTTTALTGVITPAVGWQTLPINFVNGLNAVIGATLNVTIVYN